MNKKAKYNLVGMTLGIALMGLTIKNFGHLIDALSFVFRSSMEGQEIFAILAVIMGWVVFLLIVTVRCAGKLICMLIKGGN